MTLPAFCKYGINKVRTKALWISRYEYVQLLLRVTGKGIVYMTDPHFFAETGRKYLKQNCQ
jgi:hypothetical protein